MNRPTLLDLFSCAGGAAVGYARAGFEVVGVDIQPQPNYPFEHYVYDALDFALVHGHKFDVIHASPPCQVYSATANAHTAEHPDLLEPTQELRALCIAVARDLHEVRDLVMASP